MTTEFPRHGIAAKQKDSQLSAFTLKCSAIWDLGLTAESLEMRASYWTVPCAGVSSSNIAAMISFGARFTSNTWVTPLLMAI